MAKANSGTDPIAPYVAPNLATFYEVCFVQKKTDNTKTTMANTFLAITTIGLSTVKPFHLCIDNAGYHPIVVEIGMISNPPALSTDDFTLKIISDTD